MSKTQTGYHIVIEYYKLEEVEVDSDDEVVINSTIAPFAKNHTQWIIIVSSRLLDNVTDNKVERVVITYKDRLSRVGFDLSSTSKKTPLLRWSSRLLKKSFRRYGRNYGKNTFGVRVFGYSQQASTDRSDKEIY